MSEEAELGVDKPNLEYFVVSSQFDGLWLVERNEHYARHWVFERQRDPNRRLLKMFVGWCNAKVFVLALCDRPVIYVWCRTGGSVGNQVVCF